MNRKEKKKDKKYPDSHFSNAFLNAMAHTQTNKHSKQRLFVCACPRQFGSEVPMPHERRQMHCACMPYSNVKNRI